MSYKPRGCAMMNEYVNYFDFLKSQEKNNLFSNPNIKQLVNVITGNEKMKKLDFSNEKEAKVAKLYMRMYFSLVMIRWCRGETLGVARQKSLEQMDNFVKSKTNTENNVDKYLLKIKEQFHPEIARINMNDKDNSNKNINIDSGNAKKLEEVFAKEFKQCLKSLNEMSQQNIMENTLGKDSDKNTDNNYKAIEKQQLIKQILLQQIMNQRAA